MVLRRWGPVNGGLRCNELLSGRTPAESAVVANIAVPVQRFAAAAASGERRYAVGLTPMIRWNWREK